MLSTHNQVQRGLEKSTQLAESYGGIAGCQFVLTDG